MLSLLGNVCRHRLSVATLAADVRSPTKAQSAQAVHPQPPPLQAAQPYTHPAPPVPFRPHPLNPPPSLSTHWPQANAQANAQVAAQGPAQVQHQHGTTSNPTQWQQQQQQQLPRQQLHQRQQHIPSAAQLSAKPVVPSLHQMQKAPSGQLSAHPVMQQASHSLALHHNSSLPVHHRQAQPRPHAATGPPLQLQAQLPPQLQAQLPPQLPPQQPVLLPAQLSEAQQSVHCHEPCPNPAAVSVRQQGLAQGQQACRPALQSPQPKKMPPPPPPLFALQSHVHQPQLPSLLPSPQAAPPPASSFPGVRTHPMTHGQSPLQARDQAAAPAAAQAVPGQQVREGHARLPAARKGAVAGQSPKGLYAQRPAQALKELKLQVSCHCQPGAYSGFITNLDASHNCCMLACLSLCLPAADIVSRATLNVIISFLSVLQPCTCEVSNLDAARANVKSSASSQLPKAQYSKPVLIGSALGQPAAKSLA